DAIDVTLADRTLRIAAEHGLEGEAAVTVSFLTLAFGQLWRVVAMWQPESGVFSNEVTRNRYVWAAAWGLIALLSLVPLGVGQIMLLVRRYNNRLSTPR
ncbi:MAG: cation transporting ATPase C-terminal domain-containing protein, partial [Salinibacter sp.]